MKYFSLVLLSLFLSFASYAAVGPITGTLSVCAGSETALGNATTGGTWSTTATATATVDLSSGVVTGVAAGTARITYTINPLDYTTAIVTVMPTPAPISGTLSVCTGYTTALSSSPAGGTWSSGVPSLAGINATTGVATGLATGNASIFYTLANGCVSGTVIAVNATPIVTGTGVVCFGSPGILNSASAGTWTSSNTAIATVNASTGVVSAVALGTVTITNTLSTGCYASIMVAVHAATTNISGPSVMCNLTDVTLGNATPGGTWSSSATGIATIGSNTGVVTGVSPGNVVLTYFISSTGCYTTANMTVNGAYPIGGLSTLCSGLSTTYSDATPGGTWSSSNPAIATVNATTGTVTGISPGAANISYTVPCGSVIRTITINSTTPPITGVPSVCLGSATTLGDPASGGSWSSSNTGVATINASTGLVTSIAAGTTTIYYNIGICGSVNTTFSVNPLPAVIGGPSSVCGGGTATLSSSPAGGTWSSLNTAVATVAPATGVVTGVTAGGATLVYTLPTGCTRSKSVTVTASAVISGNPSVCLGGTSPLSATGGAGVWSVSTPSVATVSSSGLVSGVGPGVAIISYTVSSTGCTATMPVTVSAVCSGTPVAGSAVASATTICSGNSVTLSLTGAVVSCGVSAQWQYSDDGTVWVNIAGATNPAYVFSPVFTRYYRNKLTCAAGGAFAYSSPVMITTNFKVAAHTETTTPSATCGPVDFYVTACGASATLSVKTYFGDGANATSALTTTGVSYVHLLHSYTLPGTYTIKHVLYNSGVAMDSVIFTYEHLFCKTLAAQFYNDNNANCLYDAGDTYNVSPVQIEIDSNNVAIDTITVTSGLYRKVYGAVGTVYAFRFLAGAGSASVSCPSSGVLYDTIVSTVNNYPVRYFGLSCISLPGYDLAVNSSADFGPTSARYNITVSNSHCTAVSPVVTMSFSPDYTYTSAVPAPTTVSGTTVTWNLPATSAGSLRNIALYLSRLPALPPLAAGDTINSTISVGPVVADLNLANNVISHVDTVRATYAQSNVTVLPTGHILPCTELQYKVKFENTGFDTARNVYVLDTLAPELDPASLNIVSASAAVNLTVLNDGVHNIARFDFPAINLLDSSHHGLCEGMVTFSVKARNGLTDGTVITNHTGIVFDDFSVLPANDVNNIIGIGAILGGNTACTGTTSTILWDETAGGTWYNVDPTASISPTGGVITGIAAGTTIITYTVSNSCATRVTTLQLTINPSVIPSVHIGLSTADTICSGTSTIFTALTGSVGVGANYDWKVNGATLVTGTSGTFTYASTDSDIISVTVAADSACAVPDTVSDTLMMRVVTTALPSIVISVAPSDTSCEGLFVNFTSATAFSGPVPGYTWKVNGAAVSTAASYDYVPANGDVVYCTMGSDFMCRTVDTVVSNNITMTVNPAFIPLISIVATPGLTIGAGNYDTLTAVVTGAGPTPAYQWQIDGVDIPGETSAVFITNALHDYDSVGCSVTGSGVCAITTFTYIFVTVYNVGVAQYAAAENLGIFPNPNKGSFRIKGTLTAFIDKTVSLEITDMIGQVIYSNTVPVAGGKIDETITLNNTLANGMYLLNLHTATGSKTFHFVVEQ